MSMFAGLNIWKRVSILETRVDKLEELITELNLDKQQTEILMRLNNITKEELIEIILINKEEIKRSKDMLVKLHEEIIKTKSQKSQPKTKPHSPKQTYEPIIDEPKQNNKPSEAQMAWIIDIMKTPGIPAFRGTTKKEAGNYIDKYKNQHKAWKHRNNIRMEY